MPYIGASPPRVSTESTLPLTPPFPQFGPETPRSRSGKPNNAEGTKSICSKRSTRSDRRVYPFDCASYNPLVALAATVDHILYQRLHYCEDVEDIHYFEVKNGQGSMCSSDDSLSILIEQALGIIAD